MLLSGSLECFFLLHCSSTYYYVQLHLSHNKLLSLFPCFRKRERNNIIHFPSLIPRMVSLHIYVFYSCCFCNLQESPEIDLAVYQEMWFPVAVVAGVTIILIFLAIVCLVRHSILFIHQGFQ